jgi:hypothetical protein
MRVSRVRFTVRRLMVVTSVAAALLATYKAGQLYRPTPRLRTITVDRRSANGSGDMSTYQVDVSTPNGAAEFRRMEALLKAEKVEHQIR